MLGLNHFMFGRCRGLRFCRLTRVKSEDRERTNNDNYKTHQQTSPNFGLFDNLHFLNPIRVSLLDLSSNRSNCVQLTTSQSSNRMNVSCGRS